MNKGCIKPDDKKIYLDDSGDCNEFKDTMIDEL